MINPYILLLGFIFINIADGISDSLKYLIMVKKYNIDGVWYKITESFMLLLFLTLLCLGIGTTFKEGTIIVTAFALLRFPLMDTTFNILTGRKLRDFGTTSVTDKIKAKLFDSPTGVGFLILTMMLSFGLGMYFLLNILGW